ncbi:hypothetical protein CPAST_c11310 [Clostridium pasteurianum DSM 525 = ATCC 6013]|uniref:Uncharacterized protein n=1 Tax=Clostridium pasteurianum DSM 525 = ATCC 6013 TaxID=1262449 RepID=A0A0H3J081_CLOPA|nr:hypothetical protein [Clostridium pasteurianum]AJA47231.1 hypothetical protein CPAST_c11310 [Clostridium pasteurianum DSM 525 = ATCC 6013]AJA51219.1 hypothetical protein CLPA_c11310 [Clostridium pasteurianum DSM 525 = ATCC 6013]AOZ74582.1 hypothetical protein AQ983_05470 [Clostridium pasteurianum DSM 525 = ATCC 6013]AOZ78379.1 hypothetical protein AQ984_05460 [Clostridium pasteurianum]ELP59385.1 hypothetical protein F502_08878 [Clostridium pasteurianum DSM 525 = ATCC 6013]
MEKELEQIYKEKLKSLTDYLDKHDIKVLYVLEVNEKNSIGGKIQYYFVHEEDREHAIEKFKDYQYKKYEITEFDDIYYDKGVPTFSGDNGVEFGSIVGLIKFKQELRFIKIPNKEI